MDKKKFLLVGHCPPPISGQTEAFDLLREQFDYAGFPYAVIDIGSHHENREYAKFNLSRAFEVLKAFIKFEIKLLQPKLGGMYLSIALSRVGFLRDFFFIWLAKIRGLRIVLQLLGGGYNDFCNNQIPPVKFLIQKTISQADRIIVESSIFRDEFDFVPNHLGKVIVVHNTTKIEDGFVPAQKDYSSKPFKILYMSNLIASKGYLDLLDAYLQLPDLDLEVHFCGKFIQIEDETNLTEEEFITKINDTSNSGKIKYHGVVAGKDKWELFRDAHVFVLPTYYKFEGQPISIIEALAFGLPIITTKYRSMVEMVINGENGFFVDPKTPEQITEKIKFLYENRGICERMGKASINLYHRSFSREINKEKVIELFSEYV